MRRLNHQITLLSETDPNGYITFVNDAFCEISKYKREELIGKPHNIIRHPDMPQQLFKSMWATIKRGETFRGVIKNMAKDGIAYWVSATIMPTLGKDHKVEKYIGIRHLLTDQKLAQALYDNQTPGQDPDKL